MNGTTQAMTPVDAAWLHIDGPANLAQVTGILLTDRPLDFGRVKEVYRRRLCRFDRFRQRVVEPPLPLSPPRWEEVKHFDVEQQMHHLALPAPHDKAALMDLVSDLASTPLDRRAPLWQVHVVDEVEGGSALVMRFHHCLGDGTAMMAVSRELFDDSEDAPAAAPPRAPRPARPHPQAGLLDRLVGPVLEAATSARGIAGSLQAGLEAARHPARVAELVEAAGRAASAASLLFDELRKPPDPRSPLKGDFGSRKRVAWSEPVSIGEIKAVGRSCEAKVNDVLVAAATGALRGYLRQRGFDVDHATLRAMVPVDLRPRDRALELGNDFGLVILELPIRAQRPLDRLRVTRDHMDALKRSPEALAIRTLLGLFGRGPKLLEDAAVDLFGSRASLVMSNVAGPRGRLYLAGVPIRRMMFWVPHPGRQLGMGISILSYDGFATLTVIADARLVPDPEAITRRFDQEFRRLRESARRRTPGKPAR
ncbi:MAG TPA: wax ester/triacylglycerol synthase family O-acyltransferase [Vicinamibacteria bacterium]|nr:wax ester/triacylglycerol synthase family O-acyltransferase [Vicinamibacteria bacterium]